MMPVPGRITAPLLLGYSVEEELAVGFSAGVKDRVISDNTLLAEEILQGFGRVRT